MSLQQHGRWEGFTGLGSSASIGQYGRGAKTRHASRQKGRANRGMVCFGRDFDVSFRRRLRQRIFETALGG